MDSAVPAIVAQWSVQELIDRATPGFGQLASTNGPAILAECSQFLGPLVQYHGCQGLCAYYLGEPSVIRAHYVAKARCSQGEVEIEIDLMKKNGQWKIAGFFPDSPLLPQR